MKAFIKANEARLALEYLPTYAPECNPIELVWAWVKNLLSMRVMRSLEALKDFWGMAITIVVFLGLFTKFWNASAIGSKD